MFEIKITILDQFHTTRKEVTTVTIRKGEDTVMLDPRELWILRELLHNIPLPDVYPDA